MRTWRRSTPRAFERIASDELEELAGLFPSLRSLVPEPAYPTTPSERIRVHRAVAEMIARLAGQQPVLLLLDDLHWADGASVEQAGYVLRRPPEAAVMIVGSYRTGQAEPALWRRSRAPRATATWSCSSWDRSTATTRPKLVELSGDAGRLVRGERRQPVLHAPALPGPRFEGSPSARRRRRASGTRRRRRGDRRRARGALATGAGAL